VDAAEVERVLLSRYDIRVGPEMTQYVLRQLQRAGGDSESFAVMGGEARTGVPIRIMVDRSQFGETRESGS
jgi:hypothetical protein